MDDKQTLELYQEILRGAQIGIDSIDEMLKKSGDRQFAEELRRTQNDYKYIAFEANDRILEMGGQPKELSLMTKVNNWSMVSAATLLDSSNENISRLLLRGIDTADKSLSDYQDTYINADERAKELAERLLRMQDTQRNVYRKYLN